MWGCLTGWSLQFTLSGALLVLLARPHLEGETVATFKGENVGPEYLTNLD